MRESDIKVGIEFYDSALGVSMVIIDVAPHTIVAKDVGRNTRRALLKRSFAGGINKRYHLINSENTDVPVKNNSNNLFNIDDL
jgi:hypothetical protein